MTSNTTGKLQRFNKSHPIFPQPQGLREPKQEKDAQGGNPNLSGSRNSWACWLFSEPCLGFPEQDKHLPGDKEQKEAYACKSFPNEETQSKEPGKLAKARKLENS